MELIACQCELAYGLPHDHYVNVRRDGGGFFMVWDESIVARLWVDWKAVARDLITNTGGNGGNPG